MFSIKVENFTLDLPDGNIFKWIKNSELFSNELPEGEYSYPINLSLKSKATALFFQSFLVLQSKKLDKHLPCSIHFQNVPIDNNAKLIIRKSDNDNIQGYILTGTSVLVNLLKEKKLNEIDLGSFNTGGNDDDMVAHMLDTANNFNDFNHVFAPVKAPNFSDNNGGENDEGFFSDLFSGQINGYSTQGFYKKIPGVLENLTEYVPFPKLTYILTRVFNYLGFKLDWPLMEDPTFKKIVIVNNTMLKEIRGKTGFSASGGYQEIPYTVIDMQTVTIGSSGFNITQNPINGPYLNFNENHSFNNFDTVLNFDLNDNSFTILEDNIGVDINFSFTYARFDDFSFGNQRLVFEVWIDDEYFTLVDSGDWFTIDLSEKHFTDKVEIILPAGSIGKKLKFKAALVHQCWNCWDSINETGTVFEVRHTKILNAHIHFQYKSKDILKNVIDYNQHVTNDSLSEFLDGIRKRFGAYVQNVDYVNKKIYFRQKKDVFNKITSKPILSNRNKEYKLEIENFKYVFLEEFSDDDLAKETLYLDSVGEQISIVNAELTHDDFETVEINLKYPSVFMRTINGFIEGSTSIQPFVGFKGKLADNEGANMRLALYHGFQSVDDNALQVQYPYISAYSYNSQLLNLAGFSLALNQSNSFFKLFLERWYNSFSRMEIYEFDVYPTLNELINFKIDKLDWYQHQLFICRKIEFNLKSNIERGKMVMVKLLR